MYRELTRGAVACALYQRHRESRSISMQMDPTRFVATHAGEIAAWCACALLMNGDSPPVDHQRDVAQLAKAVSLISRRNEAVRIPKPLSAKAVALLWENLLMDVREAIALRARFQEFLDAGLFEDTREDRIAWYICEHPTEAHPDDEDVTAPV